MGSIKGLPNPRRGEKLVWGLRECDRKEYSPTDMNPTPFAVQPSGRSSSNGVSLTSSVRDDLEPTMGLVTILTVEFETSACGSYVSSPLYLDSNEAHFVLNW